MIIVQKSSNIMNVIRRKKSVYIEDRLIFDTPSTLETFENN